MNRILIISLLLLLSSCKPLYTISNGVNRSVKYVDKENYCQIIQKKYNINTSNMIFIDEKDKNIFMNHLIQENVSFFYGVVLNKIEKVKDNYLSDANSCMDRVYIYLENDKKLDNTEKIQTPIANFNYKNSKEEFVKIEGNRLMIFVFSVKIGKSNIKKIRNFIDVIRSEKGNEYNYYLISID